MGGIDSATLCMLIDNNALEYLHSNVGHREHQLLKEHFETGRLVLHISPLTYREQIKGVNKDCFQKVQSLFKTAYELTQRGHILPEPQLHVGFIAGITPLAEMKEDVGLNIRLLRELVIAPNYQDWVVRFEELKSYVQKVYAGIHTGTTRPSGEIPRDAVYTGLLRRYKLESMAATPAGREKMEKLTSLRYLITVHHYYYETILATRAPMSGDWIDLEQVIYLNIADYILSRDRKYCDLLNNCGNDALRGRMMKPDVFLRGLKYASWPKRAPDHFDTIDIPI